MNKVTTIQLTGKALKTHMLISYCLLAVGLFLIFTMSEGELRAGWGFISTLAGIIWLIITRIRIWWNHA